MSNRCSHARIVPLPPNPHPLWVVSPYTVILIIEAAPLRSLASARPLFENALDLGRPPIVLRSTPTSNRAMAGWGLQRDQHRELPGQKPNQLHATRYPDGWQEFWTVHVPKLVEVLLASQNCDVRKSPLISLDTVGRPQEATLPKEPDRDAMFPMTPLQIQFGRFGDALSPPKIAVQVGVHQFVTELIAGSRRKNCKAVWIGQNERHVRQHAPSDLCVR